MKSRSRLLDLLVILVLVALGCAAWGWFQPPANPLVGRWRVVEQGGHKEVIFSADGNLQVVDQGRVDPTIKGRYSVNWSTRPAQLDVISYSAENPQGKTYAMICEVTPEGDLRVEEEPSTHGRPTAFSKKAALLTPSPLRGSLGSGASRPRR